MKYNPQIHHRRSIRLKGYDYSKAGLYFITICCQDMKCRFGKITVGASLADAQNEDTQNKETPTMELNELGQIAYDEWTKLPERFTNIELDVFQIMPNHMHGIIILNDDVVRTTLAVAPALENTDTPSDNGQPQGVAETGQPQGIAPTIGDIVGAYKSLVANGCLEIYKMKNESMGKLWQRNYHEHIIRNEKSYHNISNYIINNPAKWADDKFYKG